MVSRQKGVTLIELVVTVTLMGLLFLVGSSFSKDWIDSARRRNAANLLELGITRARAVALRNPGTVADDLPASSLCLSGSVLKVVSGGCTDNTTVQWQANLPQGITLKAGSASFSCMALDNRASLTSDTGCISTSTLGLSVYTDSSQGSTECSVDPDCLEVKII